jgi:hypothetical protein
MTDDQAAPLSPGERQHSRLVAAMSAGFVVAGWVMPLLPASAHSVPLCPFRALTGHSCPGCGMTRACVSMLHGDVWTSLTFHPLGWLVTLALVGAGLRALAQLVLGRRLGWRLPARLERLARLATIALFTFVFLFGAVRLALELAGILTPV